ncbi:hypothetical protein O1611_g7131 [Lasiodiplodia mahajangana]|uniref:Uncharacterized protein n=1 Tax=Lasiodiplodia mahajangana TaxID=1108764 RepID=A0ACC2JGZ1_9PEZI|nr:hypothetical protein O1611_g7131 [Lasiodiplodia mahajangana]
MDNVSLPSEDSLDALFEAHGYAISLEQALEVRSRRKRSREEQRQQCDSRIEGWLQYIKDHGEFEPPAKRVRYDDSVEETRLNHSYAPHTPPLTDTLMPRMPGASADSDPDAAGGKRFRYSLIYNGLKLLIVYGTVVPDENLKKLEKPVHTKPLPQKDASEILPEDVRGLFRDLDDAINKVQVVPYEVKEDIATMVSRVFPHYFSDPDPDVDHVAGAKATFGQLREIIQAAVETAEYQRHECAWNSHVYEPLLKLAFSSSIMGATNVISTGVQSPKVRARWEPIMSATIAGDSIPYYQSSAANSSIHLACSVTSLTDPGVASIGSTVSLSEVQSRKDSKKVDFAIVLDVAEDEPLQKTIVEFIDHVSVGAETLPHVNQTIYRPLNYSPIAVSIEAKVQSVKDPLIQLSVWTAAWHKRMYGLRWHLGLMKIARQEPTTPRPRLVTLPLIQIFGHNWQLYFACDMEESIHIYGPLPIGSTDSILSIYVLMKSLGAIREWVESTFYGNMKSWFMCNSDI